MYRCPEAKHVQPPWTTSTCILHNYDIVFLPCFGGRVDGYVGMSGHPAYMYVTQHNVTSTQLTAVERALCARHRHAVIVDAPAVCRVVVAVTRSERAVFVTVLQRRVNAIQWHAVRVGRSVAHHVTTGHVLAQQVMPAHA